MKRIKGELISFKNNIGLHLNGILFDVPRSTKTIIHIHGSYGNFYTAEFIKIMASIYTSFGYNFLSFNLTCHDGFAEGYINNDEFEYVGGAVSDFNTCVSDIQGAIDFAKKFSKTIILQGHSLGCDRVVYYILKSGQKYNFVLLSPCDSYYLQTKWIKPYTVEQQIKRIEIEQSKTIDFDWLPLKEYGVYSANEDYILPITRQALLSIMKGPPFKLFNISIPFDFYIKQKCFIYIGGKDNLQTEKAVVMFDYFKNRIKNLQTCFIEDGDHMMKGFEALISKRIIQWIKSLNKKY